MLPWLAWTLCRPGWPQLTEICLPLLPKAGVRDLYAPPHLACFFSPDMGPKRTKRKLWALSPTSPKKTLSLRPLWRWEAVTFKGSGRAKGLFLEQGQVQGNQQEEQCWDFQGDPVMSKRSICVWEKKQKENSNASTAPDLYLAEWWRRLPTPWCAEWQRRLPTPWCQVDSVHSGDSWSPFEQTQNKSNTNSVSE